MSEETAITIVVFVDDSKAFDKILFGKLFKTLFSKKVSPLLIKLIFIRQEARVSWGSHFSCYFHLSKGVKQGGQYQSNYLLSILINCYWI